MPTCLPRRTLGHRRRSIRGARYPVRQWGETAWPLLTLPGPAVLVYAQRVCVRRRRQVDPNRQRCGRLAAIARSRPATVQSSGTHPVSGLVQRRPSKRWSASANVCLTSRLSWTPPGQQRRPAERHSTSTHFRRRPLLLLLSENFTGDSLYFFHCQDIPYAIPSELHEPVRQWGETARLLTLPGPAA